MPSTIQRVLVRGHDQYSVAWICALPLETAAARAMLDEVHGNLPQPEIDHNTYTLGEIHGHNVVITCLPKGVYGTIAATEVLAQLLRTFPSVKSGFGLMVGIGGGVPQNKVDIRLGDVVVSVPDGTCGGVIQYDRGKTVRDGRFQRTGSLNSPPKILLTAVSQISSNHIIGTRSVNGIMLDALEKYPEIREKFCRPSEDLLFPSTYDHQMQQTDCSACDQSLIIHRPPRETDEPQIHYGIVASGNQVMKDARTRDAIAQQHDILCFETEAAGLMNQLPCLVIRGICDYSDSHKQKQWQAYSALSAAAYAKALLNAVPTPNNNMSHARIEEKLGSQWNREPWNHNLTVSLFNNHGNGNQSNVSGGSQNNNLGRGNQFFGNFSGSVCFNSS